MRTAGEKPRHRFNLGHVRMSAPQAKSRLNSRRWLHQHPEWLLSSEHDIEQKTFIVRIGRQTKVSLSLEDSTFKVFAAGLSDKPVCFESLTTHWSEVAYGTYRTPKLNPNEAHRYQKDIGFNPGKLETIGSFIEEIYREAMTNAILAQPFEISKDLTCPSLGRAVFLAREAIRLKRVFYDIGESWSLHLIARDHSNVLCLVPSQFSSEAPPSRNTDISYPINWMSIWSSVLCTDDFPVDLWKPNYPLGLKSLRNQYLLAQPREGSSSREILAYDNEWALRKFFNDHISKFFS